MQDPTGRYFNVFLGCIAGGAAGDAWGFPVEFLQLAEIVDRYGQHGIVGFDMGPNGKALISDDTQMTLFTMDGLTTGMLRVQQHNTDSPAEVYIDRAYLDWYATQHPRMRYTRSFTAIYRDHRLRAQRAPARACLSSLSVQFQNPRDPRDDYDVGRRGTLENPINTSKECGTLCRVSPVGLMLNTENYNLQAQSIALVSARTQAITHGSPLAWLSAALFGEIINRMIYRRPADPTLERIMANALYQIETQFRGLRELPEFVTLMEKSMQLASDKAKSVGACMKELGQGQSAEYALAIAIFLTLRHQTDYFRAVHAAVNRSGDSCAVGSLAGSLLGSWLGFEEVARQMDFVFHTRGYIQQHLEMFDLIQETAQRAYRIAVLGE